MLKKAVGLVTTAALVVSIALSGCSKSQSASSGSTSSKSSSPVTITFWDENAGPTRTPYYTELINRFQTANPNIKVSYLGLPQDSAQQKMNVAVASNTAPDVSGMQVQWLSTFVMKKCLLPLDSYFNKWSGKDDIASSYIMMERSVSSDKKLYQLPWSANLPVLWYRTDLFQQAGLSVPTTWSDFFTDITKLTDKSKNQYGFTLRGGSGGVNQVLDFLYSYSGTTSFFDSNGKSTLNQPAMLEGFKKYIATYKASTTESDITNNYQQMVAEFDSGSAAIMLHNLGSYTTHQQSLAGKFAAMPIPKGVNGKQVVTDVSVLGPVIYKSTKHPDAAWAFVSYLGSHEAQSYWNKNIAQIPTNTKASSDDWVKDMQHIQQAMAYLGNKNTIIAAYPYYLPDFSSILANTIQPEFQQVLAGKVTAETFLNNWADALTKSQAEYSKNVKASSSSSNS